MRMNILMILALLSGCMQQRPVCPTKIANDLHLDASKSCWIGNDGHFHAFVILTKTSSGEFPTFFPAACRLPNNYNELNYIAEYRSLAIYGRNASRNVPTSRMNILYNTVDHKPKLAENDSVYYIRAKQKLQNSRMPNELILEAIYEFKPTGMTLREIFRRRADCKL